MFLDMRVCVGVNYIHITIESGVKVLECVLG